MRSLKADSCVLVTGASSGFGALIVRRLAEAGHRVAATMRATRGRNREAADALRDWAEARGHALRVYELDVTEAETIDAAVRSAETELGRIEVVVQNAGLAAAGLIETFDVDTARLLFDVNVFGPLRLARAVLPSMRAHRSGLFVYVSSTDGREVMPFVGIYNASKAALEALAESLHYEIRSLGIETAIVQPGSFPTTGIIANLIPPDEPDRAAGYGAVAEAVGPLLAGFGTMVERGEAPDPDLIAEAVSELVAGAPGTRPLRIPVDPSGLDGAARINATASAVQGELLARFGLDWLAQPEPEDR